MKIWKLAESSDNRRYGQQKNWSKHKASELDYRCVEPIKITKTYKTLQEIVLFVYFLIQRPPHSHLRSYTDSTGVLRLLATRGDGLEVKQDTG